MVSTAEDADTRRRTSPKASVNQSLLRPVVKSEALPDEISLTCSKIGHPHLDSGPNGGSDIGKDDKNFVLTKDMRVNSLEISEPEDDDELGCQQTAKDLTSDHSAMKIRAQGSKGDPTTARSGEQHFSKAGGDISHLQCLEFLCRKGPGLLIGNLKDKEKICSVLLNMADIVKVLPPADEPLPRDILSMTLWQDSLWALVLEMKTVEKSFPSLTGNSGVYVLTASPYSAFLRALSAEIADRRN